jgi:hypothetical protein
MLAFEHPQRDTLFQQPYSSDENTSIHPPYPGLDMDSFNYSDSTTGFHPLPFSYFDNPGMFASAPAQSMKPQMTRTISNNSAMHQYHHSSDAAPGLISSASSSTVGSPYSGPLHTDSMYNHNDAFNTELLSHGLGLLPTIVNQDSYTHEFAGFEPELPIGHDKLNGNFVGESADLSSSLKRSTTFPCPINRNSQSVSPATPLNPSPELLTANTPTLEQIPVLTHPTSFVPVNRCASLPVSIPQHPSVEPVFKSPTTPASAYPRTPSAYSPLDRRVPSHGAQLTAPVQQPQPAVPLPAQPMRQHGNHFQSHFFAQSSGNFMPPLETSCWFSFLVLTFLFPLRFLLLVS